MKKDIGWYYQLVGLKNNNMENETLLMIYAIDYPTMSYQGNASMINEVGIITKNKFHEFINLYREEVRKHWESRHPQFESVDQIVAFSETMPALKGEIKFTVKFNDGDQFSFSLMVAEFKPNSFKYNKKIIEL